MMLVYCLRGFDDLKLWLPRKTRGALALASALVLFISMAAFALLAVLPAQAAQLYQWKDAQGRVHYSDQPPPSRVKNATPKNFKGNFIKRGEPSTTKRANEKSPVRAFASPPISASVSPVAVGRQNVDGRQVVVTVLSWYSPLGALNGSKWWRQNGYNYKGAKASKGIMNYPLAPEISLPVKEPQVGSREFHALQYQAALEDLRQMQIAGFDVAAFDMPPMPAFDSAKPLDSSNVPFTHYETFLQWLKAGEVVGMKVALFTDFINQSADYPKGYILGADEWIKVLGGALDNLGQSSALWRLNGRPVVIHFGTDASTAETGLGADKPDGGWQYVLKTLRERGRSFYFIADIRPHLYGGPSEWSRIADAVHMFAPASPTSFMTEKQTELSATFTVPYMWSVSPGYYNSGVEAYTEPDFRRIHETYLAAMKAGAKLMNVMTWNDFGEDTDIAPSANKGRALLNIFSYYNNWFKSGVQPVLKADEVILAYPARIPTKVHTRSPAYGLGKWVAPTYTPKVFYWANIKTGRTLEVVGVGKVDLPSGLSMGEVGVATPSPLFVNLGAYSMKLPVIARISEESQQKKEGGLEYRYLSIKP